MCARNNLIFKFDRNSYDKSTVEEIVNSDFINKCLSKKDTKNDKIQEQGFLSQKKQQTLINEGSAQKADSAFA